jgi:cytochrome c5
MKKRLTFIAIITAGIFLINCKSTNKISYNLPNGITEDDSAKKKFVKQFNEGKILYQINCAKCHSTTVNGKEVIPDFTLEQLTDYEIRMQNPKHAEDLRETNITQEELEKVILFFRYKKRNPVVQAK